MGHFTNGFADALRSQWEIHWGINRKHVFLWGFLTQIQVGGNLCPPMLAMSVRTTTTWAVLFHGRHVSASWPTTYQLKPPCTCNSVWFLTATLPGHLKRDGCVWKWYPPNGRLIGKLIMFTITFCSLFSDKAGLKFGNFRRQQSVPGGNDAWSRGEV